MEASPAVNRKARVRFPASPQVVAGPSFGMVNGQTREKYNAYLRSYMRFWRAVRAGRADWWPRRST